METRYLFMNLNVSARVSLSFWILAACLMTTACRRHEEDIDNASRKNVQKTTPHTNEVKPRSEANLEKSKQEAVSRFPELGVAGSEMNKAFLARVNHLRATGSLLLNEPNWPYLVAVQVGEELRKAKEKAESDARQKYRSQTMLPELFTVTELLQQKTIPFAEIELAGIVTRVDIGVANRLAASVVLDNKLKCETEMSMVRLSTVKAKVEISKRGDALFGIYRVLINAQIINEVPLYKVGQRVRLVGRVHRKGDVSLLFKFEPPSLNALNAQQ